MSNKPFFSVVIPVHNKEPHVERALQSVLAQTCGAYEVIAVDDASTDKSLSELEKFNSRIKILRREKPGPGGYAARNLGVREAKGEWVAFLDADDEWMPQHLENYQSLIQEFPEASMLSCGWENNNPDGLHSRQYPNPYYQKYSGCNRLLTFNEYLFEEVSGRGPVWTSVACVKKEVMLASGGFPEEKAKRGGDVDTWLRCIEAAGSLAWSSHIGAIYHRDAVNMVTRTQLFLAECERATVRKMLPAYNGQTALMLKRFSNRRTINAWKQNIQLLDQQNFRLTGKLYQDVQPMKNIFYMGLSLLPSSLLKGMQTLLRKGKITAKQSLNMLKRSPVGTFLRFVRSMILRATKRAPETLFNVPGKVSQVYLEDEGKATFFGYHDKTPLNEDESMVLAMSVSASDRKARSEGEKMEIGLFRRTSTGDLDPTFHLISETTTWCWQQGCMLQWNPSNPNREIIFNKLIEGQYGAQVIDVVEKKVVISYEWPIYSVSPCGEKAASLNFSRLGRLRPGYGYDALPDATNGDIAPGEDGLFIVNLITGERKLLINLERLAQDVPEENVEHYINHATFSTDGSRLTFFHLWSNKQKRHMRFCEADIENGSFRVLEENRMLSHYCWRSQDELLATTRESSGKWHYTLYHLGNSSRHDLNLPFKSDGHPMFCPVNKDWIVTDSYPDKRQDQHLYLANIHTSEVIELAAMYSPFVYRGQVRCDLHPRWDRSGKCVVVDTTQLGKRKLLVIEIPDTNRLTMEQKDNRRDQRTGSATMDGKR